MKSVEFLSEAKDLTPEEFDDYIDSFIQSHQAAISMRKILASPYSAMFQDAYSTDIYRAWYVNRTLASKIKYGGYAGKGKHRRNTPPEPVLVKYKAPFVSFSWTKAGAKRVAMDDRFAGSNVTIITKQKLQSPDDVLFNMAQYGKEAFRKLKVKPVEKPLMMAEKEVILKSSEYYLTIDPKDVIFISSIDW